MTPSSLFSSFGLTYHVPSIGLLKRFKRWEDDTAVVYHPYSQSLIEVSQKDALILKLYELGFDIKRICKLVDSDEQDVVSLLVEIEQTLSRLKPQEVIDYNKPSTLWLITDLRCNMQCRYCYTAHGSFNLSSEKTVMSAELAKNALDKLIEVFPTLNIVNLFGGGEPLLSFNLIRDLVNYSESQGYNLKFGIVTNGILINREIAEFLASHNVSITISIDGPPIVNDINRIFPDGSGSYFYIEKAINILHDYNKKFAIEATYTPEIYAIGYEISDVVKYLGRFTPYILIKSVDYVPSTGAGFEWLSSIEGELWARYVYDALMELEKSKPAFYDINISYAISYMARKATKEVICPFTGFITLFPDGKLILCHILLDFTLGTIFLSTDEIKKRYLQAVEVAHRLSTKFSYRDIWMAGIQDICPVMLFGGLTKLINAGNSIQQLPIYQKDSLESYWDTFLISFYGAYKKGTLNQIYDNVWYLFKEIRLR
jgi:uncharacterized protein